MISISYWDPGNFTAKITTIQLKQARAQQKPEPGMLTKRYRVEGTKFFRQTYQIFLLWTSCLARTATS